MKRSNKKYYYIFSLSSIINLQISIKMKENNNYNQEQKPLFKDDFKLNNSNDKKKSLFLPKDNNTNTNNKKGNIRIDYYGQEISKNNKKHKISFIDQIQSKKNLAQIIYINDQVSLKDDKNNTNNYLDNLRKQSTNITDNYRKENKNEIETYKIKRPKSSSKKIKRKKDKIKEQCGCIIF